MVKNRCFFVFKEQAWRVLIFTYEETEVHKLVLKVGFADSYYKISPNSNKSIGFVLWNKKKNPKTSCNVFNSLIPLTWHKTGVGEV